MEWNSFKFISWKTLVLSCLVAPCLVSTGIGQSQSASSETSLTVDGKQEVASKDGYFSLQPYQLPSKITPLDKKILATMGEYHVVGLSVAVIKGDKMIWSGGYGWADLRTMRPTTPETIFRSASISKMITATALMQLYEQKKFQLDDDISSYLGYQVRNPHYPDKVITFRQLLTHTSSIVDAGSYDRLVEQTPELLNDISIKEILVPSGTYYGTDTFGEYEPGKRFNYSNFGTAIAASLVESISNRTFAEYCRQNIFKPLGMDASFQAADVVNWRNIGVLYRANGEGTSFHATKDDYGNIKPIGNVRNVALGNALGDSPAGGARMSIIDLSKFMIAHMNGGTYNKKSIIKKDTADLMHGSQWFGNEMDGLYRQKGFNFHISDDFVPGQRLIGHSAEAYGLIGDAYYDPDTKYGVAFLINGGNYTNANPYYDIEKKVARLLYDQFAPKEGSEKRKIRGKVNDLVLTVNERKVFMPIAATEVKTKTGKIVFIPEITAADALKTNIEVDVTGNILTYTKGKKNVVVILGETEWKVNGKKKTLLAAPYKKNGHIMVPLVELRDALEDKASIDFR